MKKIALIITFLILFILPVHGQEIGNQTVELITDNFKVENINDVVVEVTTPYIEKVTLTDLDYQITYLMAQMDSYKSAMSMVIDKIESLKTLRDKVLREAEKAIHSPSGQAP